MKNNLLLVIAIALQLTTLNACAQTLNWENQEFEIHNVKAVVTQIKGEEVIQIARDMKALPFDKDNLFATVDEPTFIKIKDLNFTNGTIEVKVLSRILDDAPPFSRGFIGIAFRVNEHNTAYESIYLRPTNGRANDQIRRNHTIQYYSYPDYKFNVLRETSKGEFETYANIGLDEWITMRIEVKNQRAVLYLNNKKYPSFIVNQVKGKTEEGSVGLWVDIGTKGFFKDLKITIND